MQNRSSDEESVEERRNANNSNSGGGGYGVGLSMRLTPLNIPALLTPQSKVAPAAPAAAALSLNGLLMAAAADKE